MDQPKPMPREQLREVAVRRRGDSDVRALLLEVKRLRELALRAYQYGGRIFSYRDDAHEAYLLASFAELFEREPVVLESMPLPKRQPPGPERHWPHMSEEREAKLLGRMRRG